MYIIKILKRLKCRGVCFARNICNCTCKCRFGDKCLDTNIHQTNITQNTIQKPNPNPNGENKKGHSQITAL